ncbi:hypothetical protein IF1G_01265 [Cordyceps javanica]|uniref:Uncharacterized protein n=1 Tax=Cordyceps javanica TaxID=43265 RepID=A0A545VHY4_9HYPO|nr:hypothetical protein IF1G_01265 [Cordyceps javanica]
MLFVSKTNWHFVYSCNLHVLDLPPLMLTNMTATDCNAPPPYTEANNAQAGEQDAALPPYAAAGDKGDEQDLRTYTVDCANYFAPECCSGLQIGTVFDDLDSPSQGKKYQVKESSFAPNQSREISLPSSGFYTTNNSGILNKVLNALISSREVKPTYTIEQLSITECCVDEKLINALGELQGIREMIENSTKKTVFFIYGIAHGATVQISKVTKTVSQTFVFTNKVFGIAVLQLTLNGAVLRWKKFAPPTHLQLRGDP